MNRFKIKNFTEEHIEDAAELFVESYEKQREQMPLIPERPNLYKEISKKFTLLSDKPSVAAFEGGELVGYMLENWKAEDFMSKRTAFSLGLYSHSSITNHKERIYQKMYERLSKQWVEDGYHTHILSYWAGDETLTRTLYRLGFGMTHFELMRDLTAIETKDIDITIRKIDSMEPLKELHIEELEFYQKAPLFWVSNDEEDHEVEGELIAAFDNDEPVAYIHLKTNDAETPLLADEETGRVAGAYAYQKYRGKGIGTALLNEAVKWARKNKLKRLYVEGESANIQGGNFWMKYFNPVVHTVRRCVDERV